MRELALIEERFDVVIAGAIIEHLADPVAALGSFCRAARETVILPFTEVGRSSSMEMTTMNPWRVPAIDYAWWKLSQGLFEAVLANLGFTMELKPCAAIFVLDGQRQDWNVRRSLLVASRRCRLNVTNDCWDDCVADPSGPLNPAWRSPSTGRKRRISPTPRVGIRHVPTPRHVGAADAVVTVAASQPTVAVSTVSISLLTVFIGHGLVDRCASDCQRAYTNGTFTPWRSWDRGPHRPQNAVGSAHRCQGRHRGGHQPPVAGAV